MNDSSRSPVAVNAAGRSDKGQLRQHNEDETLLCPEFGLYAVADGAGGHRAGDIAAALACRTLEMEVSRALSDGSAQAFRDFGIAPEARALSLGVHKANGELIKLSRASDAHRGLGSTIVAAVHAADAGVMYVAHLGDSRCYRLRGGRLEQLTGDHRLLSDILEQRPDVPPDKLQRLPKNVVTRALGMAPSVRVPITEHRVVDGDRFLLCSDGLSGPVGYDDLNQLLVSDEPPEVLVEVLIDEANHRGGPDNIAAIVIDCEVDGPVRPSQVSAGEDDSRYDPELLILGIEELDVTRALFDRDERWFETLMDKARRK